MVYAAESNEKKSDVAPECGMKAAGLGGKGYLLQLAQSRNVPAYDGDDDDGACSCQRDFDTYRKSNKSREYKDPCIRKRE